MKSILSLDEEKEILSLHIAPATGRPRQLLDVLLEYYPIPAEKVLIKQMLSLEGKHTLGSVLRNAKIFIGIHQRYDEDSKKWYYALDDYCIRIARFNRIMNSLVVSC